MSLYSTLGNTKREPFPIHEFYSKYATTTATTSINPVCCFQDNLAPCLHAWDSIKQAAVCRLQELRNLGDPPTSSPQGPALTGSSSCCCKVTALGPRSTRCSKTDSHRHHTCKTARGTDPASQREIPVKSETREARPCQLAVGLKPPWAHSSMGFSWSSNESPGLLGKVLPARTLAFCKGRVCDEWGSMVHGFSIGDELIEGGQIKVLAEQPQCHQFVCRDLEEKDIINIHLQLLRKLQQENHLKREVEVAASPLNTFGYLLMGPLLANNVKAQARPSTECNHRAPPPKGIAKGRKTQPQACRAPSLPETHLRELAIAKPLDPPHARHGLSLGGGFPRYHHGGPPGEALDLPPHEVPYSKLLPILEEKPHEEIPVRRGNPGPSSAHVTDPEGNKELAQNADVGGTAALRRHICVLCVVCEVDGEGLWTEGHSLGHSKGCRSSKNRVNRENFHCNRVSSENRPGEKPTGLREAYPREKRKSKNLKSSVKKGHRLSTSHSQECSE
ncbi:hypothetical protein AAY473_035410 [Plecturocebus cupreus]